jgi:DNA replication and repair protein RecF
LNNFRNWENLTVGFSDRTLIYGPNALGKTNILEALYTLATTRSFKGKDPDVIKKGAEFSRIAGVIEKDSGDSDVEVFLNSGSPRVSKNFKIKGAKKSSIDFVGEFSAIVFSPDDLLLISGPPEIKRRYLSFTIGQKDREYLFNLLNYKKILRHRNDLLKKADLGTIREEIDIWNETLAENGQKIIEKRKELANFINERINSYYEELAGEAKELTFDYRPELWGESLLESLRNAQDRDIYEKVTTVGPHRDNWVILTNEGEAANFASRGEYRTIILALKLCEKDWFLEKEKDSPVILLDDVFSELDESRRKYLVNAFNGCQIIMTTTDLDHLDPAFHADTLLLNIQDIGNALSEGLEKEEVLF